MDVSSTLSGGVPKRRFEKSTHGGYVEKRLVFNIRTGWLCFFMNTNQDIPEIGAAWII